MIKTVYDYHEFKDFKKRGNKNNITYGVELEYHGLRYGKLNLMQDDIDLWSLSEDGSLNDGLELISQPATLGYWLNKRGEVEKLLNSISDCDGYVDGNAGYHIHIDRAKLSDQDIKKIGFIFETLKNELITLSGRYIDEVRQWAKFMDRGSTKTTWDWWENTGYCRLQENSRYCCVNLQNRQTVEIRLFQSTLNSNNFYGLLKLVDNIVKIAQKNTNPLELEKLTLKDLITSGDLKTAISDELKALSDKVIVLEGDINNLNESKSIVENIFINLLGEVFPTVNLRQPLVMGDLFYISDAIRHIRDYADMINDGDNIFKCRELRNLISDLRDIVSNIDNSYVWINKHIARREALIKCAS